MIVVGIPNTDRTRDMTPTQIDSETPSMNAKNTGGGPNFLKFIEKELTPHIDLSYPTQPYRMLIGHSLGGLVVMNALITRPTSFNAYICIDPSMWYNKTKFLQTTKKALSEQKYTGTALYLGIANTMSTGMTLVQVDKDTSANAHINAIRDMDKHIKSDPQNGLRYRSTYYSDDTHGSVPLMAEYNGLRFIFDFHDLKMTTEEQADTNTVLADRYKAHYTMVSKRMGYTARHSEPLIN